MVRNLHPDTSYMFLVRAQNNHGLSPPSTVSEMVRTGGGEGAKPTLTQYEMDQVKLKLDADLVRMLDPEVFSATVIQVKWETLRSHRFIEGYHIKYRPINGPNDQQFYPSNDHYITETVSSSRSTIYVLRNLKKYHWYDIHIQPFYQNFNGRMSNGVRVRTLEDGE